MQILALALAFVVTLVFSMVSWKVAGVITAGLCAVGVSALYKYQSALLYYPQMPTREYIFVPSADPFRLEYEDVYITTEDGEKLHAWFIRSSENYRSSPTLIYFHGNAGSMLL